MGCGGSKDENPNEIKYEMVNTKIPKFDELFDKASKILQNAETTRAGL